MSVLLLLLGVVTTAAGLALVASGATIRDGALDTDIITPGTIAAVGGLLLIGIGLAVRELLRIEQALVQRPALRPARSGEALAAAAESPDAPVRIPFPPKPKTNTNSQAEPPVAVADAPPPSPAVPAGPAAPAPTEDGAFERLRAKFPTLARLENSAVVAGAEVSMVTRPPIPVDENIGEVKNTAAVAAGRTNGATPARAAPRLEAVARPAGSPDRAKGSVFNAFWPAGPRRHTQTAPAQVAAPVAPPPSEPTTVHGVAQDPSPAAVEPTAAAPVSALKSGVVEGMAYTLYSDGSIETQLPQGKLRFGSISALRHHLERGA
jgi:hypothetical protein